MISVQEINEKVFEKAVFGGYDMASVDDFLRQIAEDYTTLAKENATLKAKMRVLVSKVEEYRENEESLQKAVLSAQRLGGMIEKEAREKAEEIVSKAQAEADAITAGSRILIETEEARMASAKQASSSYIESMRTLCQRQLQFLERVSSAEFDERFKAEKSKPAPAPVQAQPEVVHETVKTIEESVARAAMEPDETVRTYIPASGDAYPEQNTRPFKPVESAAYAEPAAYAAPEEYTQRYDIGE